MRAANRTGSPDKRMTGRAAVEHRARYLRAHPLCQACEAAGRIAEAVELDHRVPLSKGGDHSWENLSGLCKSCHAQKTRRDLGQRERIGCGIDGFPLPGSKHPWAKK